MADPYSDHFDAFDEGGVTVVRLLTELLRHPPQAEEMAEDLNRLVDQDRRTRIVINLRKTRYMGSSAFAALIGLARKLDAKGGKLVLCEIDHDVMVGANILGLGTIVPICDTEAEALMMMAGDAA